MVLLLVLGVVVVLLAGYPVAFSLAGTALLFAAVGAAFGLFDAAFLAAMPNRLFGVMTNDTLIEMAKAGLADENLMLAIDAARDVDFDTSPTALIALAKGGVSRNVIAHMQKKKR